LEKIVKKFELFGIQTHPIPLNPHGLRANRTSPKVMFVSTFLPRDPFTPQFVTITSCLVGLSV
jgi:hypothetical protein